MALGRVVKPRTRMGLGPASRGVPVNIRCSCIITDDNTLLYSPNHPRLEQLDSKFSLLETGERTSETSPLWGRENGFGSECSESRELAVSPNVCPSDRSAPGFPSVSLAAETWDECDIIQKGQRAEESPASGITFSLRDVGGCTGLHRE